MYTGFKPNSLIISFNLSEISILLFAEQLVEYFLILLYNPLFTLLYFNCFIVSPFLHLSLIFLHITI